MSAPLDLPTVSVCVHPDHDHEATHDEHDMPLDTPQRMRCHHCRKPCYYDEALAAYQHDDRSVCLLTGGGRGSRCIRDRF